MQSLTFLMTIYFLAPTTHIFFKRHRKNPSFWGLNERFPFPHYESVSAFWDHFAHHIDIGLFNVHSF